MARTSEASIGVRETRTRWVAWLVCLGLVAWAAAPGQPVRADDADKRKQLATALTLMGYRTSLRSLDWITAQQLQGALGKGTQTMSAPKEAFLAAFAPDFLEKRMIDELADYDPEELGKIIKFTETEIGKKILDAEASAAGNFDEQALVSFSKAVPTQDYSPARLDAVGNIARATERANRNNLLFAKSASVLSRGFAGAMRHEPSLDGLKDLTSVFGEARVEHSTNFTGAELLYVHKDCELDHLRHFAVVVDRHTFQAFTQAAERALGVALREAESNFTNDMFRWAKGFKETSDGATADAAGSAFGQGKIGNACLDEALQRDYACEGLACNLQNGIFLSSCLTVASKPPMCAGIPSASDVEAVEQWNAAGCTARRRQDSVCRGHLDRVQASCRQ